MSHKKPKVETVVANAGLTTYPIPKKREAKLDKVEIGGREFDFLVATYCFDAQRKLLYFYKAALPLLEHADPEFLETARRHSEEINRPKTWEERAKIAERIMIELQKELDQEMERGALAGAPA
jgi:hypothetical protein